jgi:DnaK suppressor protein
MEDAKAKELLSAERSRVERLLKDVDEAGAADRDAANQSGDMYDSAEPLTTEGTDESIRTELEERLAAIGRAEQRLAPVPTVSPCAVGSRFPTTDSQPTPPPS